MADSACISVENLHKSYGDFEAVRGIDLEVKNGEVYGLLGPNGAGKTTTLEILEGLRPRTSGAVSVLGLDPASQSKTIKDRIGVCLQATNLPDKMKVHEALDLFGGFLLEACRSRSTSQTPAALGQEGRAIQIVVRRPETASGFGALADQRSQPPFPRRAHHRPRPPSSPRNSQCDSGTEAGSNARS